MTTLVPKYELTGTGTVNRAINLKFAETVSAGDFGVTANGTTDDTSALQSALTYAGNNGCLLILPAGNIKVTSALTFSVVPTGSGLSASIQGQGQSATLINYSGNSNINVLTVTGNYAEVIHLSGFAINNTGTSTGSNGFVINKIYGSYFSDLLAYKFSYGFSLSDTNSNKFTKVTAQNNSTGFSMAIGSGGQSYPNLNDFDCCNILNNTAYGVYITNGTNNTFRSCNFGQNVSSGSGATIRMDQEYGGNGGGFSLVENCYFEGNQVTDFLATCNGPGSYVFVNNSFNKLGGSTNVTHHIILDASPLGSGTNLQNNLCMLGNTFAALNGYTGSNSPISLLYGTGGYTNFTIFDTNVYELKTETPSYAIPATAINYDKSGTTNKVVTLNFTGSDTTGTLKNFPITVTSRDQNFVKADMQIPIGGQLQINGDGLQNANVTTTQKNAISGATAGLVVFDTTLGKLCVYTGSAWQTITSS